MDEKIKHDAPPHDENAREPLGPFTPDDESPAGDTPEVHDSVSPHDIPKSNPGRPEAVRQAGGEDGRTTGNVESPLEGDSGEESTTDDEGFEKGG